MLLSNSLFIDEEYKLDCEHKLNYLTKITEATSYNFNGNENLIKDISTDCIKVLDSENELKFIKKSNTNAEINNNE